MIRKVLTIGLVPPMDHYTDNMKKRIHISVCLLTLIPTLTLMNCNQSKQQQENLTTTVDYEKGSYGYDLDFLEANDVNVHELVDETSSARVMVVPQWQGRVMTSTAADLEGKSYGWINYDLIDSKEVSDQFNPFGGEERFWLGPEGGPFSIYFKPGDAQEFSNWVVPSALDTESFDIESANNSTILMTKDMSITNAAGNTLSIGVRRTVKILDRDEIWNNLSLDPVDNLSAVAYESTNSIKNDGDEAWTGDYGFVSVWLLCMFNPSVSGVVFIPVQTGDSTQLGKVVTDDYFGKVPADRLKVVDDVVFFKVDGNRRSKIGISPQRATPFSGSYDKETGTLTIVWFSKPNEPAPYVNSLWGDQDDPLMGDAVNSYNDGPTEDGSIMGPFYEIESSSPAALLDPADTMTHLQRVYHFQGDEKSINTITKSVFGLSISEIKTIF